MGQNITVRSSERHETKKKRGLRLGSADTFCRTCTRYFTVLLIQMRASLGVSWVQGEEQTDMDLLLVPVMMVRFYRHTAYCLFYRPPVRKKYRLKELEHGLQSGFIIIMIQIKHARECQ